MIIFVNDDRAYLAWITHHRQGYVLDGTWRPRIGRLVLHRATCVQIKVAASKRTHWTTASRLKACSLDRDELQAWGIEQSGGPTNACEHCQPEHDSALETPSSASLTRQETNILDYVLDTAVIHMDHEYPPYRLSVADIAACMDKTAKQVQQSLQRLAASGLLSREPRYATAPHFSPRQLVFPTSKALRTLPAFQAEPDSIVEAELLKLTAPQEE